MAKKEAVVANVLKVMKDLKKVRNIAIIAHVDHGKTTTADSLLASSGLISEELAGDQKALDSDEIEQMRSMTIKASNVSLFHNHNGDYHVINLIDTPGHVDFGGHVTKAMRAVDGVILVVDAAEGVMPQTETVLRQALKEKAKPIVFINKIDRLINELKLTPEGMQKQLTKVIIQINKLIQSYGAPEFKEDWKVNVESGKIAFGSAYYKWGMNINIMKKTGLSFKDIYDVCEKGTHKEFSKKVPLADCLLGMCIDYLPNPLVAQPYRIPKLWKGDMESPIGKNMATANPNGPVCMVVTGITVDPHAGEVATGRIYSGTIKKGVELHISSLLKSEKVQQVNIYMGPERFMVDEIPAGNIGAIVGIRNLFIGETLSSEPIEPFEKIKHYSEPVITKSIEAKNPRDLVTLMEVLQRMSKEDPTLKVEINQETGEHLISGMGELHLEIVEYKVWKDHNIEIVTSPPIVVYRETIKDVSPTMEGKSPNKHNKFKVIVEPMEQSVLKFLNEDGLPDGKPKGKEAIEKLIAAGLPRDEAKNVKDIYENNLLLDMTRGVQFMNELMELITKGFRSAMDNGPMAKEKVTGVKVKIVDGLIHEDPVHRGPAQILPAIRRPIYGAMLSAGISMLEPKVKLLVQAPQEFMSGVIQGLQTRRGQVNEIEQEEAAFSLTALVPVADMFGYSNEIRGATEGRAMWYTEYAGFEPMQKDLQLKIVKQIRDRKGEPEEIPQPADFIG